MQGQPQCVGRAESRKGAWVRSGTMTAMATPTYRYSWRTAFTARLIEPAMARNLWVGNGQVVAGGLLFVGNGMNASSSVSAIFEDLEKKGVIGHAS